MKVTAPAYEAIQPFVVEDTEDVQTLDRCTHIACQMPYNKGHWIMCIPEAQMGKTVLIQIWQIPQ